MLAGIALPCLSRAVRISHDFAEEDQCWRPRASNHRDHGDGALVHLGTRGSRHDERASLPALGFPIRRLPHNRGCFYRNVMAVLLSVRAQTRGLGWRSGCSSYQPSFDFFAGLVGMNNVTSLDAAITLLFHSVVRGRGANEFNCSG